MSSVPAARIQRVPRRAEIAGPVLGDVPELYPSLLQSLKTMLVRRRPIVGHRPSPDLAELGRATGARI